MTAEWLLLATGFLVGWWASRWWTEARRARVGHAPSVDREKELPQAPPLTPDLPAPRPTAD